MQCYIFFCKKCLLVSRYVPNFIIKLRSQKYIFKFIKKKHGKDISNILRSFESLKTKFEKTKLYIDYIKLSMQVPLLPTFFI